MPSRCDVSAMGRFHDPDMSDSTTTRPDRTGAPAALGVAHRDDVDLWYDVHGAGDSTVLLLAGAACQATQWELAFFVPLVDAGHTVVRFDWRDTGLSSWRDFRTRPYTVDDLVDDAIAVLDDAGIDAAHLVGFSMGGLVAQGAAVHHPERVRSLALLASGYYGGMVFEDTHQSRALMAFFQRPRPKPNELEDWLVEQWRTLAGRGFEYVPDAWHRRAREWLARGHNPRCPHLKIPGHEQRLADPAQRPEVREERLGRVGHPTLVVHGDDDGMFTPGNGEAIAAAIPGARRVVLPGRGHDLFCDPTGEIGSLLVEHLREVG
jgi:pimeloyl-ACP methyl ester carboxylesterase